MGPTFLGAIILNRFISQNFISCLNPWTLPQHYHSMVKILTTVLCSYCFGNVQYAQILTSYYTEQLLKPNSNTFFNFYLTMFSGIAASYFHKVLNWIIPLLSILLVYLPSCLGQETAKWPLRSSSQAATCSFQSNHSKVEATSLKGY